MSVEKPDYDIDNKSFGEKLKALAAQHKNLITIALSVGGLKKGAKLDYKGQGKIGRKELRSLSTKHTTAVKSLKKNYVAHGRRRKTKRRKTTSSGLNSPVRVSDTLRQFFSTADLGPINPNDPNSAPLTSVLSLVPAGVTSRSMLTVLFNIYVKRNQMARDPAHKSYLTATPQMAAAFSQSFASRKGLPQVFKSGKPRPIPFGDPNKFLYVDLQDIIKDNVIPKTSLSAADLAALDAPPTKERIAQEQQAASAALKALSSK